MLFEEEYEKMGEAEVRKGLLLPENARLHFFKEAPAWLAHKESERISRSDAREAEIPAIAKEAMVVMPYLSKNGFFYSLVGRRNRSGYESSGLA